MNSNIVFPAKKDNKIVTNSVNYLATDSSASRHTDITGSL